MGTDLETTERYGEWVLAAMVPPEVSAVYEWVLSMGDRAVKHPLGSFWPVLSGVLFPLDKILAGEVDETKLKWVSPTLLGLFAVTQTYGVFRSSDQSNQARRNFELALVDQQTALTYELFESRDRILEDASVRAGEASLRAAESERRILRLIDERLPRRTAA